jgi:CHASE2 domain-containing sensor protein
MYYPNDRPLEIIKWVNRALYLMLFISWMVVMGYWHVPITFTFLGSVTALILSQLFYKKEDEEKAAEVEVC